jgi:hypothetical protein
MAAEKILRIMGELFGKVQVSLQASAAEDWLYEVMDLQIGLDMRKWPTGEGKIWASKWNFDQAGHGKDQKWIQALFGNIEWLAWKILVQGGE